MKYKNIRKAIFKERINRFVSLVELDGEMHKCHVKNTGRCKELLWDGAEVYIQEFGENSVRKTKFDLITVRKDKRLINIDSQAPNSVFEEYAKVMFGKNAKIKREITYGNSRFDFYIESEERKIFLEIKGVTLEKNGVCAFPDAPTQRGVKHIKELCKCIDDGYEAYIVFIIQMKNVLCLVPNYATHFEFGQALKEAKKRGVNVMAFDCDVKSDEISVGEPVLVDLNTEDLYNGKLGE